MNRRGLNAVFASMAASLMVAACGPAATPASSPAKSEAAKTEAPAAKAEAPAAKTEAGKPAAQAPASSADWQTEWQNVVEAAKKEKLVIVSHPGSDYQALMESFKKDFPGIEVEHSGQRPSDISPKIITEQQNGVFNWDVMAATTSNMNNVLLPANAFQDIEPFFVRRDVMDDNVWGGGKFEMYTSNDQKSILVHNAWLASRVYVNREKVGADKLNSIDDLLKPEFQGQIVVDDCTVPRMVWAPWWASGKRRARISYARYSRSKSPCSRIPSVSRRSGSRPRAILSASALIRRSFESSSPMA